MHFNGQGSSIGGDTATCSRPSPSGRQFTRRWRRRRSFPWAGPCRDSARRRGSIIVRPTGDGRLALVVPADGVAVLDLAVTGELRAALRRAAFELRHPAEYAVPLAG